MAELGTVFVDVKGDWSGLQKEANKHGESIGKGFGASFATAAKVGALAAGGALAAAGVWGIKAAADFQQTRIAFEGIFGDAKKASAFLKDLRDFAAKTPFELPGLQKVAKQLLATGTAASDVIPVLTTIGNVAATLGVGEAEIQGVVRALGQMKGKGKASAEELQQISEQIPGFSAIKAIAEGLGVSVEEAFKKIEKGAVPADLAIELILEGMEKFPGAAGAMDRQSKTLNGVLSTMKDELRNALIDGIEPYLPAITNLAMKVIPLIAPAIQGVIGAFELLGKGVSKVVEFFTPIVQAIWPAIQEAAGKAFDWIKENWGVLFGVLGLVIQKNWGTIVEFVQRIWPKVQEIVEDVVGAIIVAFKAVTEVALPALRDAFKETVLWVQENFPKIRDTIVSTFDDIALASDNVVGFFEENWPKIETAIGGVVDFIVVEVWPKLQRAYEVAKVELEKLVAFFSERWDAIKQATENFGKVMLVAFIVMFGPIIQVVKSTWENVKDIFDAAFEGLIGFVQAGMRVIKGVIDVVLGILTLDWERAWNGIKEIFGGVLDNIKNVATQAFKVLREIVEAALSVIYDVWQRIWGLIGPWLTDHVINPIKNAVSNFFGTITGAFQTGVDTIKSIWETLGTIYRWVQDNIILPLTGAFGRFWGTLTGGFQTAIDAIGRIWEGLKNIVKVPVNFIIGTVYNNGIRKLWNLIPGVADLPELATLNTGGYVPGHGPNKDSVPAYLTPGEFVVNRSASDRFGFLLEEINKNPKTLELNSGGIVQALAAGGYVHSPAETLAFARTKHGQPYEAFFGGRHRAGAGLGPYGYDCSGFMGELAAYAEGLPLGRRWFTASAFPVSNPPMGFVRGMGPNAGFNMGIRRSSPSRPIGHTAGTIMGVGVESTPPQVRVGNYGKSALNFPYQFHLPGFGGPPMTKEEFDKLVAELKAGGLGGAVLDMLPDIPTELIDATKEFVGLITGGLGGMGSGEWADAFRSAVKGMAGQFLSEVKDKMTGFAGDFLAVVPGLGPLLTAAQNLPGFGGGGKVGGILGDPVLSLNHGGERVLDVQTNRAFENLVAAAGGDGAFVRPIEVPVYLDSREVARAVYDPLRQITRDRT